MLPKKTHSGSNFRPNPGQNLGKNLHSGPILGPNPRPNPFIRETSDWSLPHPQGINHPKTVAIPSHDKNNSSVRGMQFVLDMAVKSKIS